MDLRSILSAYDVDFCNKHASLPVGALYEWADLMVLMHAAQGQGQARRASLQARLRLW